MTMYRHWKTQNIYKCLQYKLLLLRLQCDQKNEAPFQEKNASIILDADEHKKFVEELYKKGSNKMI